MATISNVNGKKITKIKYKGEIYDTGGASTDTDWLKELLDKTKDASHLFMGVFTENDVLIPTQWNSLTYEILKNALKYDTTSNVTNMASMFMLSMNITAIPLFNTSLVTNMSNMFIYCVNLTTIPQLDTSSVTDMSYMFQNCEKLTTIPQLDTSKVITMESMFQACSSLTTIPQIDTNSVTTMKTMFNDCTSLTTIQLDTSSVTDMSYMFQGCEKLTTIDITNMNFTSTSSTAYFADNCYSLTKLIIRNMPTIPALDTFAFNNCVHFTGTTNATYNPQGLKDGRIYVPDDKVEALKTATNWSVYADIIVPLSTLVE